MNIRQFIAELRELNTYNVDVDSDGFLYTERSLDGVWVSAWDLESVIARFENSQGDGVQVVDL